LTFSSLILISKDMRTESRTRNEAVFLEIREDILSGVLQPGSRLRFADMCERYRTSVGVVREALSRISEQGLAKAEPQLGFSVIPVSIRDLRDLTDARCDIEGQTLRYSVMDGDLTWESSIVAAHHRLVRTPMRVGDDQAFNKDWSVVHKHFHTVLLDGCGNMRLKSIALSLRDAAEVYWRAAARPVGSGQRDVVAEHRQIVDAAVNRDADAAVAALVHHIRATTDYIIEHSAFALGDGQSENGSRKST
jgi:DNA-binding GntR family transcriptional regulator